MTSTPGRLVLIGHPVSHSLSPTFQNAALTAAGIPVRYEAMDVPPGLLHVTLDDAMRERWAGNVTVPHKEAVFNRCRELTPVAQRVGAVNVFRATTGGIAGHNTDVDGFREAIGVLLGRAPSGLTFGVVGAGGSAAAVLAAIESWPGCKALVTNRDLDRLDRLIERFSSVARPSDAEEIVRMAEVVVNATSLGLREDDPLPIDPGLLRRETALYDLVYTPNRTRLVREASARGIRADDGLSMLVGQGAAAFKWWFGITPDRDVMWRSLARTAPSKISARL
jgi:shikimate dehydrogenase